MRLLIISFYFFCSTLCFGQDSLVKRIGASFSYHPNDFIFSVNGSLSKHKLTAELGVGVGINSTFFQRRLSPYIYLEGKYSLSPLPKFHSSPLVRLQYNTVNVSTAVQHPFIQLYEAYLGLELAYGNKTQIGVKALFGPAAIRKWNNLNASQSNFFQWNYQGVIFVSHVF